MHEIHSLQGHRVIRADYDRSTITVYQAFNARIADAALEAGRFVPPFSLARMTWVKPSFLWMMARSQWGTRSQQERILAIRMRRTGWERALSLGVLTAFHADVHPSIEAWRNEFETAAVHVQWDPERSVQGKKLSMRTIQVGLGRSVIDQYVSSWTEKIIDMTPLVAKLRKLRKAGHYAAAQRLLPRECEYPIAVKTAGKLGVTARKSR